MEHFNNVTREEAARVFEAIGSGAFRRLAIATFPVDVKYGDQTMGQSEAILNMLSSKDWKAVLNGEKKLAAVERNILLVDKNGRVIPTHVGATSKVCDEKTDFHVKYPSKFDYAEIIKHYQDFFSFVPEIKFLGAAELEDLAEKRKEHLMKDESIHNLIRRALPLPTPYCGAIKNKDYGKIIEDIFIPAAKRAYKSCSGGCEFEFRCEGELRDRVFAATENQKKFADMLISGPNVVWYFPNSMQGFSSDASCEAMTVLNEKSLALSGLIEPLLGLVGYAEILAKNFYTPGYLCSGIHLRGYSKFLLVCEATDSDFILLNTDKYTRNASDGHSSGLTFIG